VGDVHEGTGTNLLAIGEFKLRGMIATCLRENAGKPQKDAAGATLLLPICAFSLPRLASGLVYEKAITTRLSKNSSSFHAVRMRL
jgi:hypothetical protein